MAIREVLTSFTFEQQRLMINSIGVDVGDTSTLLTPTNTVVPALNEIVNGDVDLVNQTHGMDAGSLASPSLYWDAGQGFYKVDANKIGLSTGLAIAGNLEVDGDITFRAGAGSGGTLTFGDLNTDNIVFNAELNSSIVPDSTANYNLGSATKQWNNLWVDGTASIDTLTVDENSTFTGYLQVDSGDVRVPSTQTTVDLFDDYATDVEVFGAGTAIRLGATTGTLTLRNPTIVGSETTQDLFNTVATTVNAFGAATTINMGVAGGGGNTNFNILSDDVVCSGDLNVNGGELLSQASTVDVFINNNVRIGNSSNGSTTTTILNTLALDFSVNCNRASGTNINIQDNVENALRIREGSNDYVQIRTSDGFERVVIWKDLYVVGNLDISGTTTTIDTTNLLVEDKNIELGASSAPSDSTADGGGITLKATTDKTITYSNSTTSWNTNIPVYIKPGSNVAQLKLEQSNAADGWKFHSDGPNGGHLDIIREASGADTTLLTLKSSKTIHFRGGLIEKGHYDSGGGLTGDYTHNIGTYGNVHYNSTNAAGAFTYNVTIDSTSSTTLDSAMAVGETISTSLMHASNNTSYYMTQFKIDGNNVSPVWSGGSAPSAATGSGFDVYTFSIMKVGSASFAVFATFANHA